MSNCRGCGVPEGVVHRDYCSSFLSPWPNTRTPWQESTPVGGYSPCQVNRTPEDDQFYDPSGVREMTAADLGLSHPVNGITAFVRSKTFEELREIWFSDDAPHSFWLGDVERGERLYQKRLFNDGLLPLREPA